MCGLRASHARDRGRAVRPVQIPRIAGSGSTSPLERIPGGQLVPPQSHGRCSGYGALGRLAQRLATHVDLDSAPLAGGNPRGPAIERGESSRFRWRKKLPVLLGVNFFKGSPAEFVGEKKSNYPEQSRFPRWRSGCLPDFV